MRLSFVIPTFNCGEWIGASVGSCLVQTHKDVEVVIVDDGSTDSTKDYLAWLEKQGHGDKVKIISNPKNLGRSASRNIGNAAATGEAILVLDADDVCAPTRAALSAKRFEAGSVFVHGAANRMDAVGRDLGMMPTDVFNRERAIEKMTNGIVHSTVGYLKSFAEKYPYPGGDAAKLGLDDWACFISAALDGVKFDYIPHALAAYRDGIGISSNRDEADVRKFKEGYLSQFRVAA